MRQLGGRLSELPPVRTDAETPSDIQPHERHHPLKVGEPYPVEVHRIELPSVDAVSAEPPPRADFTPELQAASEPMVDGSSSAHGREPIGRAVVASPEPEAEPSFETQMLPEVPIPPVTHMQEPPEVDAEPVSTTESVIEFTRETVVAPGATPQPSAEAIVPPRPPDSAEKPVAASQNSPEPPSERPLIPEPAARPPAVAAIEAPLRRRAEPVEAPPERLQPRIMEVEPMGPEVAGGRWAEFQEFRRGEPRRRSGSLEPMPVSSLPSRSLLGADREPEHRSWFLTIGLPVIAVILAAGALLWSGWLRHRVLRQDGEMTALQEQNRKLADALVQRKADHKVPSGSDNAPAADADASAPSPAPVSRVSQGGGSSARREGVSVPPPQSPVQGRGSHRSMDTGYHPEIVPPYPTLSQAQNATQGRSNTPGQQQTNRAPSAANVTAGPAVPPPASAGAAQSPSAPVQSPPAGTISSSGYGIGSSTASRATGSGMYASALAQNIEAVQGMQRQSQVPLREFHARDGVQTKVTPGLFVSVRSPDQSHGSYALVVNGGTGTYQLRGYLNRPLALVDNATHRGYQLVILRIAGQEAYGYIRPAP